MVCSVLRGRPGVGETLKVPIKSIAQITIDDEGQDLRFPAAVFFDPVEQELYVSNGGADPEWWYTDRTFSHACPLLADVVC